ncbi:MAG: hypothetical protein O3C01_01630 [Bacteroidetes bacterium]|jgi:hypothetical protein|nr:MAG: hypothetical protein ABR90_00920 [Cryomorphaceae bacterium BACL29 MAG-121220-bin8]MDA0757352.1 hypothetical protein [Bacteroidota bacterium]|tara:strand:+ start:60232 stop:60801 length:570 start_codon:yes stop_codon:yes gene_type:complete
MKKLLLLLTLGFLSSCNNTAVQKMVGAITPEAEVIEVEVNTPAGYLSTADGRSNVNDGNPANLELWDNYISAHNAKDLDVIREMNADSTQQFGGFKIYDVDGSVIDGSDSHIELLSGWFEAENPKWDTFFSYTMKVDGQIGEWVISGASVTTTLDGEEKTKYNLADVYIEDGKIGAFWIYSRAAVLSEE